MFLCFRRERGNCRICWTTVIGTDFQLSGDTLQNFEYKTGLISKLMLCILTCKWVHVKIIYFCHFYIFFFKNKKEVKKHAKKGKETRMLKVPPIKSLGLHISVFQGRSKRGAFNTFEKYNTNVQFKGSNK